MTNPRPVRGTLADSERGSATVILVWCCAGVLALGLALMTGIGAVAARAQTHAIADVAALHGARYLSCEAAATAVGRNQVGGAHGEAMLDRCEIDGVEIQVGVRTSGPWPLEATSRAGLTW